MLYLGVNYSYDSLMWQVRYFKTFVYDHAERINEGINKLDNNNCAPSFLRSLCEIGGDCFGPRYFSEGV